MALQKGLDSLGKLAKGTINPRSVSSSSPRRECVVCGLLFPIPIKGKGYSPRKTCGRACMRVLMSNRREEYHERGAYQYDYSAMGRKGGAISRGKRGYKEPRAVTRYRMACRAASIARRDVL